ncbi:DUF982 domain-containing protein [Ensifer sesbaniae]|uniref:DUF982 domain-containing protein n=1 Tax=Ensifer sesbaniae TaxID=1214071 RepID=UPI00156A526C|nr:DUF982 domain-containing protein [Ensifer sesbaniae]
MSDIQFPVPVRLRLSSTGERVVANSWEALECLRDQWPEGARGQTYRAAYRVCRDVLDGWRQPHEARRVFVRAARRAGLLEDKALISPSNNARSKRGWRAQRAIRSTRGR